MSAVTDPQILNKYHAGFRECAGEVGRFPGLEPTVRRRLLQHLASCLTSTVPSNASATSNPSNDVPNRVSQQNLQVHILPPDSTTGSTQSSIFLNTNAGVQLLPTRLPNGDIALILPSSSASIQQRISISPTPSSSSSSPPPLAMISHSRSASTDSAASSNSPIGFERLTVTIPSNSPDDSCHSPNSVHSNYSMSHSPNSANNYDYGRYSPSLEKPLSLVVRGSYMEEKPWRPW